MWIGEHETSKFWLVVLNELRNRGVQDILICCADNLKGFCEAIAACCPAAEIQKCVVHQIDTRCAMSHTRMLKGV